MKTEPYSSLSRTMRKGFRDKISVEIEQAGRILKLMRQMQCELRRLNTEVNIRCHTSILRNAVTRLSREIHHINCNKVPLIASVAICPGHHLGHVCTGCETFIPSVLELLLLLHSPCAKYKPKHRQQVLDQQANHRQLNVRPRVSVGNASRLQELSSHLIFAACI